MTKIIETNGGAIFHHVSFLGYEYDNNGRQVERLRAETLTLGQVDIDGDYLQIVALDEDGAVFEYFYNSTPWETVQNFVRDATTLYVLAGDDHKNIQVARQETELYNDCFGHAVMA